MKSSYNTKNYVNDRLIRVLLKKNDSVYWRKMIASSKQWKTVANDVLERMSDLAIEEGIDSLGAVKLQTARRELGVLHTEITLYNDILKDFRVSIPSEYDFLFAKYRVYFKKTFFDHIGYLISAAQNAGDLKDAETLEVIATKIRALIEAYNQVLKDSTVMQDAVNRLQNLLDTVSSIDDAEKKLDSLAASGNLDPAFILAVATAYSSTKESPYHNTGVAEVMMHLYFRVQEQLAKNKPAEVRILKYLLTLEEPMHLKAELRRALTPESVAMTKTHKHLSTKRDQLLDVIRVVLQACEKNQKTTLSGQAAKLTGSIAIQKLSEIQKILITEHHSGYIKSEAHNYI